jgi:hypothetical protein
VATLESKLKRYRKLLAKHGYGADGSTKKEMERLRLEIEIMRSGNYKSIYVETMTFEELRRERYQKLF